MVGTIMPFVRGTIKSLKKVKRCIHMEKDNETMQDKKELSNELIAVAKRYAKDIRNHCAAVFVGAGISQGAGYPNWNTLLAEVKQEMSLEQEKDLISLAQYYINEYGNRSLLTEKIHQTFSEKKAPGQVHELLAQLPLTSYWTTNYDTLIEDALRDQGRQIDMKYADNQISVTTASRDAIVYKMHGDVDHADMAVIARDDYEEYSKNHPVFLSTLTSELLSKTFLFLGFSFEDANIHYVLKNLRVNYDQSGGRQHYALMLREKMQKEEHASSQEQAEAERLYQYRVKKQQCFIEDLKRYHIKAFLLDDAEQIPLFLEQVRKELCRKTVMISGSAATYGNFLKHDKHTTDASNQDAVYFIETLSRKLSEKGYSIVSGYGLGVGSMVISGILKRSDYNATTLLENHLQLYPFPQNIPKERKEKEYAKLRDRMASNASATIFLFGNKLNKKGKIIDSPGLIKEFEAAHQHKHCLIPVECTGYQSREIWKTIVENFSKYYPMNTGTEKDKMYQNFMKLKTAENIDELIEAILEILNIWEDTYS